MPEFKPDVDALLRRRRIEKPQEEFLLPAPDPDSLPERLDALQDSTDPVEEHLRDLYQEALEVQNLLDLILETAEPLEFPLTEEEQFLVGKPTLTTQDYLDNLRSEDARGEHIRRRFEDSLLGSQGCGLNVHWPVLGAFDLAYLRDSLLAAASLVEGQIHQGMQLQAQKDLKDPTKPDPPTWGQRFMQSHLPRVNTALIDHSRAYRDGYYRALATLYLDARGALLRCFFNPVLGESVEKLREALTELLKLLQLVQKMLCMTQLFHLLSRYHEVQDALLGLLKQMVLQQVIHTMATLLNEAVQEVVQPLLSKFLGGINGHGSFTECLQDEVSLTLGRLISVGAGTLTGYYSELVADLLRDLEQKNTARLQKLQVLQDYSSTGRYIQHLEQAILLVQTLLANLSTAEVVGQRLLDFLGSPLAPPQSRLATRLATDAVAAGAIQAHLAELTQKTR